jgi:hypothetical protein
VLVGGEGVAPVGGQRDLDRARVPPSATAPISDSGMVYPDDEHQQYDVGALRETLGGIVGEALCRLGMMGGARSWSELTDYQRERAADAAILAFGHLFGEMATWERAAMTQTPSMRAQWLNEHGQGGQEKDE